MLILYRNIFVVRCDAIILLNKTISLFDNFGRQTYQGNSTQSPATTSLRSVCDLLISLSSELTSPTSVRWPLDGALAGVK